MALRPETVTPTQGKVLDLGVESLRDSLRAILFNLDSGVENLPDGTMRIAYNNTAVFVDVEMQVLGDSIARSIVTITSPVLREVVLTSPLCEWIATNGWRYVLGHVTLDAFMGIGEIEFQHRLFGEHLEADEFEVSVLAVVGTADKLIEVLQTQFGGLRYTD
ncbi:MAG: hypothetical protein JHD40_08175, partial [Acidimicrobiia bacterium]|nr:hypothetical protein [Acidimicrobiia bacterium]